jgi:hypothetical protein
MKSKAESAVAKKAFYYKGEKCLYGHITHTHKKQNKIKKK